MNHARAKLWTEALQSSCRFNDPEQLAGVWAGPCFKKFCHIIGIWCCFRLHQVQGAQFLLLSAVGRVNVHLNLATHRFTLGIRSVLPEKVTSGSLRSAHLKGAFVQDLTNYGASLFNPGVSRIFFLMRHLHWQWLHAMGPKVLDCRQAWHREQFHYCQGGWCQGCGHVHVTYW